MKEIKLDSGVIKPFPEELKSRVDDLLREQVELSEKKIVVLDDDPTGIQTVHDLSVYTDWSVESIRNGFQENNKMFFILTNSRSFTEKETVAVHKEIALNVEQVAKEEGKDYLIVCRGDSTLRGHYPLETEVLKRQMESFEKNKIDGEVLCPYFLEGGRFTLGDVHYVKYGNELIPAGQTEFAKDKTFGYTSSNLKEYVEEKTNGRFKVADSISISNELLHQAKVDEIQLLLKKASGFQKIIVNATDDYDVKVFAIAFYKAMNDQKHFLVRSAAAFVKALGNVKDKPLLSREEMITQEQKNGGLIIVGSHTKKTTNQVNELRKLLDVEFIEMNSDLVLKQGGLENEIERIVALEESLLKEGKNVCVYTKRKLLSVNDETPEDALLRSVEISNAVQACVGKIKVRPSYIIAKGGITSSDIGVKALEVRKAVVLGQIQPGIPVWKTGAESKFPNMPYIIFPGNVGEVNSLKKAVEILKK